jgi:hypothetical protein
MVLTDADLSRQRLGIPLTSARRRIVSTYELTEKQKRLLKIIVDSVEQGKARQPLIAVTTKTRCEILDIDEEFDTSLRGDLIALADEGLLSREHNSRGDAIYYVKQAAFRAVKDGFELPDPQPATLVNIGAIVHSMNSSALLAIGVSNQSDVAQIVNDPETLADTLDKLAGELVCAIRSMLSPEAMSAYVQSVEELKSQVLSDTPSHSALNTSFRHSPFWAM